jgi:hypothetical protein
VKEVLGIPAAVPADADEADPKWCGRPVVHRSSTHGDECWSRVPRFRLH